MIINIMLKFLYYNIVKVNGNFLVPHIEEKVIWVCSYVLGVYEDYVNIC